MTLESITGQGLSSAAFLRAAREAKLAYGVKWMYATPELGFIALSDDQLSNCGLCRADRLSSNMIRRVAKAFCHAANQGTFKEIAKCASQLGQGAGLERSTHAKRAVKRAIRQSKLGSNPHLIKVLVRLEDHLLNLQPNKEYYRADRLAMQAALITDINVENAARTLTQSLFNQDSPLIPARIGINICKSEPNTAETEFFLTELAGVIGQARNIQRPKNYSFGALVDAGVKEAWLLIDEVYEEDHRGFKEIAEEIVRHWKEDPEDGNGRFEELTRRLFDGDAPLERELILRISQLR